MESQVRDIDRLRHKVRQLEQAPFQGGQPSGPTACFSLGERAVDRHLPGGGLALPGVHEIAPSDYGHWPAALGFLLALLSRYALLDGGQTGGPTLWCYETDSSREFGLPFAQGWAQFGVDPYRAIYVRGARAENVLWAAEEGVKCSELHAVIACFGATRQEELTLTRRLHLLSGQTGVPVFLLRAKPSQQPNAALTRWRIGASPARPPIWADRLAQIGLGVGRPTFRVALHRCRGAAPRNWLLEWHHEAHRFCLAQPLADRSVDPSSRPRPARTEQSGMPNRPIPKRPAA